MTDTNDLSREEFAFLRAALDGPLTEPRGSDMPLCVRLCSRRLLQRAGGIACANGWRGSPDAFVLTREGWRLLRAEHSRPRLRRTG